MKKAICFFMIICILILTSVSVFAESEGNNVADIANNKILQDVQDVTAPVMELNARAAVLMEESTGEVLFEKNAYESLSPASVTKIMTLLLVMEGIESEKIAWKDSVTISANAASMGGSQVFLKEGETFSVEELVKCTVIASANDAAVALSEHLCGSEEAFVREMNDRAQALGLSGSHFENVSGLDDTVTNHVMSAMDVALISKELLKYPKLFEYSSIWQDTIRDGAFTLTNTNRLVRFYEGCTGLKTGSTDAAGYCVTVTATRNGMTLISVIMGAKTRDERNKEARQLLDYGFSHYEIYEVLKERLEQVEIYGGVEAKADLYSNEFSTLVPKGKAKNVEIVYDLPKNVTAPLEKGAKVGTMKFYLDGEEIGKTDVTVDREIQKATFAHVFTKILTDVFEQKEIGQS